MENLFDLWYNYQTPLPPWLGHVAQQTLFRLTISRHPREWEDFSSRCSTPWRDHLIGISSSGVDTVARDSS